jgi:hypothetical protein
MSSRTQKNINQMLPKLLLLAAAAASSSSFVADAANNGRALTPPKGWRTWNQYGGDVNQELLMNAIAFLTDRSRTVNGKPTSLADLGYTDVRSMWGGGGANVSGGTLS